MIRRSRLILWLFLFGVLVLGCTRTQVTPTEEPTPMSTENLPLRLVVRETTMLRIEDGWQIGLQMVYRGEYADASGQTATGLLARISVWDGKKPQADTLDVHEGSVFEAGKSYQVVEIKEGSSSGKPGTREGYLAIEPAP